MQVAWTDLHGRRAGCDTCPMQRRPDTDVAFAISTDDGASWSANVRVDDSGSGLQTEGRVGFSNQWRPAPAVLGDGHVVAVWQDHREGNNDIYTAASPDGGATWGTNARVDDTGTGPSNQYSPAITFAPAPTASDPSTIVVVWQDDREGTDRIYAARQVF